MPARLINFWQIIKEPVKVLFEDIRQRTPDFNLDDSALRRSDGVLGASVNVAPSLPEETLRKQINIFTIIDPWDSDSRNSLSPNLPNTLTLCTIG
jgi:hypothetical protein